MKLLTYLIGLAVGVFIGGYLCFYGGIIQIIDGIQNGGVVGDIAMGIFKIIVLAPFGLVIPFMVVGSLALKMKPNKGGW